MRKEEMMRFMASWKMVVAELALGLFAGGFLLPSDAAEAPTAHRIALVLLAITAILLFASFLATIAEIKKNWSYWKSDQLDRLTREDPVFGMIEFEHGVWSAVRDNGIHAFGFTIEAPESGPSQAQQRFFCRMMQERARYEEQSKAIIVSECQSFDIPVDDASLRLYVVEIGPEAEINKGNFLLEFVEADEVVVHRVEFRGDRPYSYNMDD
jgi:hypothetical protein